MNDLQQASLILDGEVDRELILRARSAHQALRLRDQNLFDLFNLVENRIFFSPSQKAGGGSTSSAIGVLWMHPRHHWNQQDYIEFMIHEMTHTLLFLDERRYQHYRDYRLLSQKENFAVSAVLRKPRPLDKTIHSLMVAVEVLLYRHRIGSHVDAPGLHPNSNLMLESCKETIRSLERTPQLSLLVTDRVIELIQSSKEHLSHIEIPKHAVV